MSFLDFLNKKAEEAFLKTATYPNGNYNQFLENFRLFLIDNVMFDEGNTEEVITMEYVEIAAKLARGGKFYWERDKIDKNNEALFQLLMFLDEHEVDRENQTGSFAEVKNS